MLLPIPFLYLSPNLFCSGGVVVASESEHHSLSANREEQVNVGEVIGRAETGDLGNSESSLRRKRKQPIVCFVFLWSIVEGRQEDRGERMTLSHIDRL